MNTPTVEELLREASREVRSIMWDVTDLDGPGLGAAWPAFAANARDALAAVPLPDPATRLLMHRTERTPASSEPVGATGRRRTRPAPHASGFGAGSRG